MSIETILDGLLVREGGFINRPDDRGGPTKYGITQRTLSAWRGVAVSVADVQALSRAEAREIYADQYYRKPGFDRVHAISPRIADELLDTGVNCGPLVAVGFLKRSLNVFNQNEKFYLDVDVRGPIGPETLSALQAFLSRRPDHGELVLLRALNCLQGARYISLAEARVQNESFVYGWLLNRVS